MGCVYLHKNKITGEPYIGCSTYNYCYVDVARWGPGGINYHKQDYFWKAIQKYGWNNFEHTCLEDNIPNERLAEREIYYIAKYHCYVYDPEYTGGYNLTPGGEQSTGTWPKEEEEILIKNKHLPLKELYKLLSNRSEQAICAHRRKLKLTVDAQTDWAPIEIQFLRNNALKLSVEEIAAALGRTVSAVVHKARKLKIVVYDRTWGKAKEQFLYVHYEQEGPDFCAEALHKSLRAIYSKANQLGLKRKPGYKAKKIYNKTTNTVYNSVQEAAKLLGLNARSLQNCLSGNGRYAWQEWEYIE